MERQNIPLSPFGAMGMMSSLYPRAARKPGRRESGQEGGKWEIKDASGISGVLTLLLPPCSQQYLQGDWRSRDLGEVPAHPSCCGVRFWGTGTARWVPGPAAEHPTALEALWPGAKGFPTECRKSKAPQKSLS